MRKGFKSVCRRSLRISVLELLSVLQRLSCSDCLAERFIYTFQYAPGDKLFINEQS